MEENQKYGHLKPGKTSPFLREALGLRKNELPPYIYRMRFFGYPPGWLEDAKFVYSNLDMFDAEGKTVRQKHARKNQGLDPEKIIEYPGFNIPLERNTKDVSIIVFSFLEFVIDKYLNFITIHKCILRICVV